MTRMVRKQVYIRREQDRFLKKRARELGVSESELIRSGIEQLAPGVLPGRRDLPASGVGLQFSHDRGDNRVRTDIRAWQEIKTFIKEHRSFEAPQTGRQWTRDELYEEP